MMARSLVAGGAAKVYIAGRRADVLEKAAAAVDPAVVVPLPCDVTSTAGLQALVAHITRETGYLHLLICNSGIGGPQVPAPPAPAAAAAAPSATTTSAPTLKEWRDANLAVPVEDYARTFAVNVTSVWYTAVACLELLDRGNREENTLGWASQVVVTSSIGAFNKKAPGGWAYGQSKAAATHAVKQLGVVLPTWGIR